MQILLCDPFSLTVYFWHYDFLAIFNLMFLCLILILVKFMYMEGILLSFQSTWGKILNWIRVNSVVCFKLDVFRTIFSKKCLTCDTDEIGCMQSLSDRNCAK